MTDESTNETDYDCSESWDPNVGRIYSTVLFLATFGIPVLLLIVFYGSIGYKLSHAHLPGNPHFERDEQRRRIRVKVSPSFSIDCKTTISSNQLIDELISYIGHHQVIKMLIAVVCLFSICWTPLQIFNLIFCFADSILMSLVINVGYKFYVALFLACHWLAMVRSRGRKNFE